MKVYLWPPRSTAPDEGEGGVRRVSEAMFAHLPAAGVDLVDTPEEADVLACHILFPVEWKRRYPDKAIVIHNHGLYWAEYEWPHWAQDLNSRCMEALRIADFVTVPSHWLVPSIARATARAPIVIPHGVDLEEWAPVEDRESYVWWDKTRVDPICDPRPVNEAAVRLPDVQFVTTFGEPAQNVRVTGKLAYEDAKLVTKRAGVYLATTRETFGIATLQALAAGVPVVGFAHGAQPDLVKHGETGYLVKPGDYDGLADGILWALTQDREAISAKCRAAAAAFTWEDAARQYAEAYRAAAEKVAGWRKGPRTSIIVTAYNLEKYLPDCLNSVLAQSDPNWECIIVDDASPDRCGAIADEYAAADSRFRVIHNRQNQYLANARNTAIDATVGRYVLPLDADDMLPPGAVKAMADFLDSDRAYAIAYGKVYFVQENGVTPENYGGPRPGYSGWPVDFDWYRQAANYNLLPYSSMFRREAWEATGGYRPRCKTGEDADFWTRATSHGFRPKLIGDTTLIYRNREGSMSHLHPRPRWIDWFGWSANMDFGPAGAVTGDETGDAKNFATQQLPVPSHVPPLVSIIIPVGPGHERTVIDAIDSVESQTFLWWECIVVNDSGNALPSLPGWVQVLTTPKPRSGPANARNFGIWKSKAEAFICLDADDLLEPMALARMHEVYRERGPIIVYSDCWLDRSGELELYRVADYSAPKILQKGLHAVTALTPRVAWEKAGGFDANLPGWEDWGFQIACAAAGVCSVRIAEPLLTYRMNAGGRREANFLDKERNLAALEADFGDYIHGRKELMACGCSQNKTATVLPASILTPGGIAMSSDMIRVQFVGESSVARRFRGPTGTDYRFLPGEERYVYKADYDGFFAPKDDQFRVVPDIAQAAEGAPILVSANPAAQRYEPDVIAVSPSPEEQLRATVSGQAAEALIRAGYVTPEQIAAMPDDELSAIKGVGPRTVEILRTQYR